MCKVPKWAVAQEKMALKAWRVEYESAIYEVAPMLRGAKVWLRLEDGMVWWDFIDGRHEVVVDQCYHTGDWLLYVVQGVGPTRPCVWKRTKAPVLRVCVDATRPATVQAMLLKYSKAKGTVFTSDLSWPGVSAKQFESGVF
jgi:hypothetical protein